MNLRLSLLALLICVCGSCTSSLSTGTASTATSVMTASPGASHDIRPNSKGQRLEYGEIEGEFIIPSGTSAFLVQSQPSSLSALHWIFGFPAWAEEVLTDQEIRLFKARVDGETVEMNILNIQSGAGGEYRVHYLLKQVPVLEYTQLLEFYSPSETIVLKGIVPQIQANQRTRLSEPVDLDTTAVLEVVGRDENFYIHQLSIEDIRTLAQKPEVQNFRNFLKQELQRQDNRAQQFSAIAARFDIKGKVLPALRTRLDTLIARDVEQCKAEPKRCRQRWLQCRPTSFKRCPKPEEIEGIRSGILRPAIPLFHPMLRSQR